MQTGHWRTYLLALCLILTACAPGKMKVQTYDKNFSLSNYKTFAFAEIDVDNQLDSSYAQRIEWMTTELVKGLESEGLKQVEANPELVLNLGITLEEKVQTRETNMTTNPPNYIGQRNYKWEAEEVPIGTYEEGTAVLDFVDGKSQKLVAQSTATAVLSKKNEQALQHIQDGVQRLLKKIK